MNEQKRVKLTHGSARVDKNCSKETLNALDKMSKIAYEMESKPLNIDSVTPRFCGECPFLSITEREQNGKKPKPPHICKKYKGQVTHHGYHPELPVLDQCSYEG